MIQALRSIRGSEPTADSASGSQPLASTLRMSILPSVRIPLLRRSDNNDPPTHTKEPLLTMKLSSLSFLDSSVFEVNSNAKLYSINTTGTSTTVSRSDPQRGSVKAAVLKWPRALPAKPSAKDATECVLVQMRGSRWDIGDTILKPVANSARKFNIPNYSQSMKWKQHGSTYWCTTSGVKGPIAVMDRGNHTDPTKITIFETLHDKYDPKALSAIHGVSVILLDYLIVTALLLVTDLQEWMLVKRFEDDPGPIVPSSSRATSSAPDLPSTSDSKLRKIFYGEPIFPKLTTTESRSKHSSSSTGPMTPGLPQTPTTPNFGTLTINYTESCYTLSRPSSPRPGLPSIAGSDSNEYDRFSLPEVRSPSPLPESTHFNSRPPSHNYFDPSFYGSQDQPPVPPIPLKYTNTFNGRGAHSRPSSPLRNSQELMPSPLNEGIHQTILAPSLERPSNPSSRLSSSPAPRPATRGQRSDSIRSFMSSASQPTSSVRRPLPRPPQALAVSASPPTARRVQSSSQLRTDVTLLSPMHTGTHRAHGARIQRSLPPTPSVSPLRIQHDVNALSSASTPAASTSTTPSPDVRSYEYPASPSLLSPDSPDAHSRAPPITKASQEDLRDWVHSLTSPQRDLPPEPLPSTSIYDVPPPAYETINFSRRKTKRNGSP